MAGGVEWSASLGSAPVSLLTRFLGDDPPGAGEFDAVRAHAARALAASTPGRSTSRSRSAAARPRCGGSWATSSTPESLERALRVLTSGPAVDVAARFDLDPQRVRLMPAGLLALDAAAQALGRPLADRARWAA